MWVTAKATILTRSVRRESRVVAKDTGRPLRLQLPRRLRDWLASPQERARREQLQRIPKLGFPLEPDDELPEQPSSQQSEQPSPQLELPPEPKKIGRRSSLTVDEIELLQTAYIDAYRDNPKRKQADVFDDLRGLLGRPVSDSTLRKTIISPRARK